MDKLDIEAFKKKYPNYKETFRTIRDTLPNGDRIEYDIDEDMIMENIYSKDTPYEYFTEYSLEGIVRMKITSYAKMATGIGYYYDDNSILLEKRDFDAPFAFTISQMIEKGKKEFGVDISDIKSFKDQCGEISRLEEGQKSCPLYILIFLDGKAKEIYRFVVIDGTTGETLVQRVAASYSMKGYDINILDDYYKYMEEKEKKEKKTLKQRCSDRLNKLFDNKKVDTEDKLIVLHGREAAFFAPLEGGVVKVSDEGKRKKIDLEKESGLHGGVEGQVTAMKEYEWDISEWKIPIIK